MRFIVFETSGRTEIAVVEGDEAVNVTALDAAFGPDLMPLIGMGPAGIDRLRGLIEGAPRVPAASLRPALPIARPGKVYCLGLNYANHAREGGHDIPTYPALFLRSLTSLIAAGQPIVRPRCSEQLDYEAELMVIVGSRARHVSADAALGHVFGYTLFNDASVRDYQRKTAQWTAGKNFDATGPIGPVVVTADELPAGAAGLRIQSRLNGRIMQDDDTSNMLFPVAQTIAILSEFTTLEPGDMIAMGTPEGVGHARKPPVWMKAGDVVEIEIEGIGVLRSPVADE